MHTILHFTDASLEVVDRQVADLIAQVIPVHGCGVFVVCRDECKDILLDYTRSDDDLAPS
jgi:hypothetical protein